MNSLGPFFLVPFEGVLLTPPFFSHYSIPFVLGLNGIVEVLNLSNLNLFVSIGTGGQVIQEGRSKVMYRPQDQMGPQTLDIRTPAMTGVTSTANPIRIPVAYANNIFAGGCSLVYANIYQENEVEWAPPVSLGPLPAQTCHTATAAIATSGSLTLPTTTSFYGVPAGEGTCDVIGFDLTSNTAGGGSGTLTITNLAASPVGAISSNLVYELASPTAASGTTFTPLIVRFPNPIPNSLGLAPTFTIAGLSSGTFQLNVYYSLV